MHRSLSRSTFPSILQGYFCQRLTNQMNVSPRTVAAYRDTFLLLIRYMVEKMQKPASDISLQDLHQDTILAFLDHLEIDRGNAIRTRDARLAAIRSFMRYAAIQDPTALIIAQAVQAIPFKRCSRPLVDFLSRREIDALIDAPDPLTWSGQRDQVMFATFYNTGARVSEIASLCVSDVAFGEGASITIHGKGRKQRIVPLCKSTARRIKQWLPFINAVPTSPLFPNSRGERLTRSGIEQRLKDAARKACGRCPSIASRGVSPHVFRHTTAMHLLQAGIDLSVIALWLGHESPSTTHMYMEADLAMKERALERLQASSSGRFRLKRGDQLLEFLKTL